MLGLAPVHALTRVAGAVASILNAPPLTRSVSRGISLAAGVVSGPLLGLRRLHEGRMAAQVRQGVVALSRLLVAEALAAGMSLAGGEGFRAQEGSHALGLRGGRPFSSLAAVVRWREAAPALAQVRWALV